jgi:hypothetical protein
MPKATGHGASPSVAPARPRSQGGTLAAELAQLRAIEEALRRGDAREAAALADAYERHYPHGALREEASGARVVALCVLHDPSSASASAAFERVYPASLLLSRVHAACRGGAEDSITDSKARGQ